MSITLKQSFLLNKTFCLCIKYRLCRINSRSISHRSILRDEDKLNTLNKEEVPKVKPFNENESHTWVGPPHPVSNLRLKVFPSKHLTEEEMHLYEKSKETQEWNQQYWVAHNRDFEESKKSYIEKTSKERKLDSESSLTIEEMADFYKEFLDKNYKKHVSYNWQWYKRNFELLYLSAKAEVSKMRRTVKKGVP